MPAAVAMGVAAHSCPLLACLPVHLCMLAGPGQAPAQHNEYPRAQVVGRRVTSHGGTPNDAEGSAAAPAATDHDRGVVPWPAAPWRPSASASVRPRCGGKEHEVHFLHVGKTGGTAVRQTFRRVGLQSAVNVSHTHGFHLGDGAPGDCYAFFVRDPVDRWVSGETVTLTDPMHHACAAVRNARELALLNPGIWQPSATCTRVAGVAARPCLRTAP